MSDRTEEVRCYDLSTLRGMDPKAVVQLSIEQILEVIEPSPLTGVYLCALDEQSGGRPLGELAAMGEQERDQLFGADQAIGNMLACKVLTGLLTELRKQGLIELG